MSLHFARLPAGSISPLPPQVYPLGDAVNAMRQLAAAKHIGKVVLQAPADLPPAGSDPPRGRWVVSGGMGALGALAGGACHLNLQPQVTVVMPLHQGFAVKFCVLNSSKLIAAVLLSFLRRNEVPAVASNGVR